MSDNRKILVGKRRNERSNLTNRPNPNTISKQDDPKRGIKRQGDHAKTNLANERLKRLRTTLNEEAKNCTANRIRGSSSNKFVRPQNRIRKRCQNDKSEEIASKILVTEKGPSTGFVFKEEFTTKRDFSSMVSENPFPISSVHETQSRIQDDSMEWCSTDDSFQSFSHNLSSNHKLMETPASDLYVVVDTNIFLSQMQIVKDIMTMNITGVGKPVVFIPWIVIEELDFIKEDSKNTSLKFKARDATKFLEQSLSQGHDRLKGQSLNDVNEQRNVGKSQDNKIIACCMQVLEKVKNMILLTNDINLKNKAHLNHIPVCSHGDIMAKIQSLFNRSKAEIILQKMTDLCGAVIRECAKNAYGNACSRMPICQTPTNTLEECLRIFTKYWFPVFQEMLMKQFKKAVDDLSSFLNKNKCIKNDSDKLGELLRLSVRTCLFLKDVEFCKNSVESTIREINNVNES